MSKGRVAACVVAEVPRAGREGISGERAPGGGAHADAPFLLLLPFAALPRCITRAAGGGTGLALTGEEVAAAAAVLRGGGGNVQASAGAAAGAHKGEEAPDPGPKAIKGADVTRIFCAADAQGKAAGLLAGKRGGEKRKGAKGGHKRSPSQRGGGRRSKKRDAAVGQVRP